MSRKPDLQIAPAPLAPDQANEVRDALRRVMDSHHFRGSRRCHLLLQYIIEQTVLGDAKGLKERTLGIAVFGRSPDYDTNQDPIVRSTAAEIRKKLAQYYQEPGHESETRIDLQSGSYVAEFHFNQNPSLPPAVPAAPPPIPVRARLLRSRSVRIGAICTAAAVLIAAVLLAPGWRRSNLERFWSPVLKTAGPVLMCVGQPIAYNLRSAVAQDAMQAEAATADMATGDGVIPKKDLVVLPSRYVALGDSICLVRLTSFLDRFSKPYHIRGERSTTFADLRENAAVIIAAFDNQWTQRAAGSLRFTFVKDSAHDTDMVHDSLHPENTEWRLVGAWPHGEISRDYAVVTRVIRAPTDHPVVIAAGITEYGTRAAGEFLSTPEYFDEVIPRLPRNWAARNMQVVLYVPVVGRVPGHPQVLATHVW
jgi:hypothetical protein